MKTKMKTMRASVFQAAALVVVLAVALYGCTTGGSASTSTPTASSTTSSTSGSATATPTSTTTNTTVYYTNLRNTRYCEFDLIAPPAGGVALNTVYNTTNLNDCPTALWNKENPTDLAKQFNVASVGLNGPRWWTLDQVLVNHVGASPSFGGIKAADWGSITISPSNPFPVPPYKDTVVTRDTQWVFSAGQLVYTLTDPSGKTYYMQAYTTQVNKNLTIGDLQSLGSQLQLPKGWQFKTRVLDSNLSLYSVNGQAHVIGDNLSNAYMLLTAPQK